MEIVLILFLLATVQALAEFLPISSSGHLVLINHLPGIAHKMSTIEENLHLFTNVMLHVATLFAVLIYLRKDIAALAKGCCVSIKKRKFQSDELRTVLYIAIASIPAGIIGLMFEHKIELLFSSPKLVACMLVLNGIMLLATKYINIQHRIIKETGLYRAFFIGMCQALAIIPGISRSGITIAGGFFAGIEPTEAAKFSFFMAIPVIFGAGLLEGIHAVKVGISLDIVLPLLIAMVWATALALAALYILIHFVRKIRIDVFGYYTIVVGIIGFVYFSRGSV